MRITHEDNTLGQIISVITLEKKLTWALSSHNDDNLLNEINTKDLYLYFNKIVIYQDDL